MSSRAIGLVAGTALVLLVLGAVRLAAADPLASPEQARPAAQRKEQAAAPASAPATASAPAAQWTSRKRTSVSAGVLVRAASRKPLERAPACPPAEAVRPAEEPAAQSACTQPRARGEPIEIDWHGERAAP